MATETQPGSFGDGRPGTPEGPDGVAGRRSTRGRGNPFLRLRTYYREIVSELRKVIYPTRSELVTYVTVVLIFVSFMVAAVFFLDLGLSNLDLLLFK